MGNDEDEVSQMEYSQIYVNRIRQLCKERGFEPEVFKSANTAGGDDANAKYIKEYKKCVRAL